MPPRLPGPALLTRTSAPSCAAGSSATVAARHRRARRHARPRSARQRQQGVPPDPRGPRARLPGGAANPTRARSSRARPTSGRRGRSTPASGLRSTNPQRRYVRIARSLNSKTNSATRCRLSAPNAWSSIRRVASVPYPLPHASFSPIVMWYSAEPFSPSSWLNAHVPTSRSVARSWIAIASASGPDDPRGEEALDLLGPHRGFLVARKPRDLRDRHTSGGRRRGSAGRGGAGRPSTPSGPPGTTFAAPSAEPYTIAAMRRWSELAERVAATTRTSEKTALLADYLRSLSPEELPIAAVFLTGRPFPEADQRATGLGWSAIVGGGRRRSPALARGAGAAYDRHSDLGLAVEDVLDPARITCRRPAIRRRSPRWPPRSPRSRSPPARRQGRAAPRAAPRGPTR